MIKCDQGKIEIRAKDLGKDLGNCASTLFDLCTCEPRLLFSFSSKKKKTKKKAF